MVIRILNITALFFMAAFADNCGCSGYDDYVPPCYKIIEGNENASDLATIFPIQNVFEKGDTITYKISVPSTNNYFGQEIDLFEKTNDIAPILQFYSGSVLLQQNEIIYTKGSLASIGLDRFKLEYDSTNNTYELDIKVVLLRTGLYSIYTHNNVAFKKSKCEDRYVVETNIKNWENEKPEIIEFYVKKF